MNEYVLLYSLFGYQRLSSKRALVRVVSDHPAAAPVKWQLLSVEQQKEIVSGVPKAEPVTYGMRTYSCDFSQVTWPELYTLRVTFSDGSALNSQSFEISHTPYFNQLSRKLAIDAAKARLARGTRHLGFYDCNSRMGEAYSHGAYLNGLCWFDVLHRKNLTPSERAELRWAEQTAFDYLMALYVPETGEFINYSDERPYDSHNFGVHNTSDALYGICTYLSLIAAEDTERLTLENIERAEKSFDFVWANWNGSRFAQRHRHMDYLPVLGSQLYHLTGKEKYLRMVKENLLRELPRMDIKLMQSAGWMTFAVFEGVWMAQTLCPEIKETPEWTACMALAEKRLYELLDGNAYQLATFANIEHAAQAWENMHLLPEDATWITNNTVLLWGLQACYLAMMTRNTDFFKVTAAALSFVCGLNFGLPGNQVNPPSENPWATASFIANTPYSAKTWKNWYFRMDNNSWASIINGYTIQNRAIFYTDERYQESETFIKSDGIFLHLASLYEAALNDDLPDWMKDGKVSKGIGKNSK